MTTHLDEGALQAFLDGELPPGEHAAAEAHLAQCGACAEELAALRALHGELSLLLTAADAAPPVAQAQMAMRGRRAHLARPSGLGAEARRALLRAAVLVLALAGVAAAAVPGSPVREWIAETVLAPRATEDPGLEPAPAPAPAPEAPAAGEAAGAVRGIFVEPEGGELRVVLRDARPGLRVRVRLTDAGQGEAIAVGATPAAFGLGSGGGTIGVVGAGPGEVRVALPRVARHAVVVVNGRTFAELDGGRLRLLAPAQGTTEEPVFRVD